MSAELDPGELFRKLHDAGVDYIVVGGFAVIAHGVQRATGDLDICPDPDPSNLSRLASLLAELEATHADAEDFEQDELAYDPTDPAQLAEGGNFRLETTLGSLDVLQWISGIPGDFAYPELSADAITAEVRGVPVTVCSRSKLLVMKRAAGRPLDLADLDQLDAV